MRWLAALFLLGTAHAAPPQFSVEGISFKLFDEASGKIVSFDKPPNPYGLNLSLLVIVKLKGPSEGDARAKLTLDLSAPASSDEATGDHAAWKLSQDRDLFAVGEKGVGYQLFLLPFECHEKVTFTATIGKSSKSVKQSLGCAE